MKKALALLVLLTGCTNYRNHFDCPPSPGVGCRSVSQIEEMIREQRGEVDAFMGLCPQEMCEDRPESKDKPAVSSQTASQPKLYEKAKGKIWINSYRTAKGEKIEGHFVYLSSDEESEGDLR